MAAGDLYFAQVRMNVANSPASMTFGYRETTSVTPTDPDETAALTLALSTQVVALQNLLSDQTTIESVFARKLSGDPKPPSLNILVDVEGQAGSQALPLTKAVLVNHKQQEANVRSNGKTYLPGFPESGTNGNQLLNPATAALVKAEFDKYLNISFNVGGDLYEFEQVIIKRAAGGGPPAAAYLVTSNQVPTTLYNQVRRRTREWGVTSP